MKSRFFAIAILLTAAVPAVFSATLDELVGPSSAGMLRSVNEPITVVQQKSAGTHLVPAHSELRTLVGRIYAGLEPTTTVEALYIYQKPAAGGSKWSSAEQTGIFNQMTALSTLSGIQYYSESRKSMRVFYESSYVTDSPSSKKILPDPSFSTLPQTLSLFARQKDLTFGENAYSYQYQSTADAIITVQENLTPLTVGIIPAAGKGKFCTVMAVIDTGDCLLIYAASMVKTAIMPGMGERIGNSFTNRAVAILKWFNARADKVF